MKGCTEKCLALNKVYNKGKHKGDLQQYQTMFLNQLHPARQRFINKGLDYRNLIVYYIIQNRVFGYFLQQQQCGLKSYNR